LVLGITSCVDERMKEKKMDKEKNGEYVASIAGGRGGGGEGRMDDGGTRGVAGRFSLSTKFQVSGENQGQ